MYSVFHMKLQGPRGLHGFPGRKEECGVGVPCMKGAMGPPGPPGGADGGVKVCKS